MGYACPVCAVEQADAEHLANHLAITASLGRSDHEQWLAEYAPEWADCTPSDLAAVVTEHAPEVDIPEVEESVGGGRSPALESGLARQSRQSGRGELSADVEGVLAEARELTAAMYAQSEEPSENENA